jgi:release factor glutamine methyltransferase
MGAAAPPARMIDRLGAIEAGVTVGALQTQSLLDALDNRILLCHALGLSRVALITQSGRALDADEAQRFAALVQRRLDGEPIAYIVGQREFFGLPFEVGGAVLIPRPDTELLVELTLERLPPSGRVLDMGTGSGAIAVALAHTRRDADVTALDVSTDALAVARRNAAANGARVAFLQSDWYAALEARPPFDRHLSEGDLRYEPVGALTDHADGLSALRIIVAGASAYLKPGGWLLMEHGYDQSVAVRQLLSEQGYTDVQSWTDLAGIERVTGARAH